MLERLRTPTDGRLYDIEYALRLGATVEEVAQASGVDPWFVEQIAGLVELRAEVIDAPVLGSGAVAPQQAPRSVGSPDRRAAAGIGR